jgi:tetratricopeptide (TPR) repeat protein
MKNKIKIFLILPFLFFINVPYVVYSQTVQEYIDSGDAMDELGDYDGAIADYTKAIELNTNHAVAYLNRGTAKYNLGNFAAAIGDYTKAIDLNPNDAVAYYNRGMAKSNLQDYSGTVDDFTSAIELDPNDAAAYYHRGMAKDHLLDYEGAIADYTKAIELDPSDAYVRREAAIENLRNREGYTDDNSTVVETNPKYAIFFTILEQVLSNIRFNY